MKTQNSGTQGSETEPTHEKIKLGRIIYDDFYGYWWYYDEYKKMRIKCRDIGENEAEEMLYYIVTNSADDFVQISMMGEDIVIVWEDPDGTDCYVFPREWLTLQLLEKVVNMGEEE